MPYLSKKQIWTQQPQVFANLDRSLGLKRAVIISNGRDRELAENVTVTTSDGSSIAPDLFTSLGKSYDGNGNFYNSLISVPSWTNTTNEASLCLVFSGQMQTGWIAGTGSATHFPFSSLLYCNTFWNGRWADGISLLSGDSWDGPHVVVITVKDGRQKIFHNGRLWYSNTSTGGFTLPATLEIFPRQFSSPYANPSAFFAWDRVLPDQLAVSYSANPWQVVKKKDKKIGIPSAGGGGITITCTPGSATTAGISAGISAATVIACNVGNATAAGISAGITSATTISCNAGTASTVGISAGITQAITVACNVGNATAAGISASISLDSSITISCNTGTATTAGISAVFPQTISCTPGDATTAGIAAIFPQSLSCNVGNATTAGITAQVDIAGQIVIGCNAGTATAAGIQANISSALVLACNAGNATTLGSTAYFPQSLQCTPGNAIALGVGATFTITGPTTIVCNVGNAIALGISASLEFAIVEAGPRLFVVTSELRGYDMASELRQYSAEAV